MLWITFIGMIVLPIAGAVFNGLITKKIDDMNNTTEKINNRIDVLEVQKEKNKEEIYNTINGQRNSFENKLKEYVPDNMYKQALEFQSKNSDEKFKSLLSIVNTQFENVSSQFRNTEEKIDDLKDLINEKFNGKKQGA